VRHRLHRAQARRSGTDAHCHQSSPQFPMARLVWQSWQRARAAWSCARAARPLLGISLPISAPFARTLLRLDGQYGTGAVLADLGGFAFVTRGKDYRVLDHPLVQARLHLPKDSVKASSGKSDGAQPRPLPRSARGARRPALPRGRRNAIGPLKRRARLVSRVQASSTNSS